MRKVRLVRLEPDVERAIADDGEYREALALGDWAKVAEVVRRVVGGTLAEVPAGAEEPHWSGYVVVDEDTREVVGSCAFKAPPTGEGTVEIAYFTYPGHEGGGYATAMAGKLIELARGSTAVRTVIAHTLPETNASTRVLQKVGMDFVGEVDDPEDGQVWRWQRRVRG